MTADVRHGRRALDIATQRALDLLAREGVLTQDGPGFVADDFHRVRERVRATFEVPQTAITPIMARLLFAIARRARAGSVLVAGSYAGNALVWLACGQPTGGVAVGVDPDADAVALARKNVRRLGLENVHCRTADAFAPQEYLEGPIDCLLVDIDEATIRKRRYADLVATLLPYLAPGGLVLAHDVAHPTFADDMAHYLAYVRSDPAFEATVALGVDPCGLAVSRLASLNAVGPGVRP